MTTEVTAEALSALRDDQQLSWAKVADSLGLGSPGAARRAYTAHVRPHAESVLTVRRSGGPTPVNLADADLDGLREALVGRVAIVDRNGHHDEIAVAKVTSLKNSTVNFHDGDKSRSVKAASIVAVR